MKNNVTFKIIFVAISVIVILLGIVAAISGLWIYIPDLFKSITIHTTYAYYLNLFILPMFIAFSAIRALAFRKAVYFKAEIITAVLALAVAMYLFFGTDSIYNLIGNNIVNHIVLPIIYFIEVAVMTVNIVYICADIKVVLKPKNKNV